MPRRFRLVTNESLLAACGPPGVRDGHRSRVRLGRVAPVSPGQRAETCRDAAERMDKEMPIPMTWGLGIEQKQVARVDATTKQRSRAARRVGFVLLTTCANRRQPVSIAAPARNARWPSVRAWCRPMDTDPSVLSKSPAGGDRRGAGHRRSIWGFGASSPRHGADGLLSTTPIEVDGRVLAVASILTILTGFIFGILPAFPRLSSKPGDDAPNRRRRQERVARTAGPGTLVSSR